MPHAPVTLACMLVLAASAAGCGGGDSAGRDAKPGGGAAGAVADPVAGESVGDAVDRVQGAATASDCEAVKGLLHSTYGDVSEAACLAVRAEIGDFRDPRGAAYGTGAAIDFRTSAGRRTVALALDADRSFRIDFVMDVPGPTIGTRKPSAFDRNAPAVVRALRSGDCDVFLKLVARRIGLGVGPDEEVCRRVSGAPFRQELLTNRRARPVALGGNGWLAFYRLRTRRDAYYTLVMAREDRAPARGAPRYVLVNAPAAG